jgi:hypothetical protein
MDEEEEDELFPTDGESAISIHALTGIQSRTCCTTAILVSINGAHLIALLDSGSTHNFIDNTTASRAGVTLVRLSSLHAVVANGDKLVSSGCCHNMEIMVHGEHSRIDCYDLLLGSFDMVLGVQWLESLRPILWDFWRGTMAFVCNGHRVLWTAAASDSIPPPPLSLLSTTGELMDELLQEFSPLLQEPSGLPPSQNRTHNIHLLPRTAPIAVRSYCYTHAQ